MLKRLFVVLFATALLASACGDDDDDGVASDTTSGDSETTEATEADDGGSEEGGGDLQLSSTDLGDVLVDAEGNTVYLFMPDAQGEPTCYEACEENWPPVGELSSVGDGLDDALLGTVERTDGDVQATYNGWPLYYFANDAAPGDTNGQGVNDVWYVVDAEGNAIDDG